jgi:hypothetical protein
MSVPEIVLVALVAIALIVPGYFLNKRDKKAEKSKTERIIRLSASIVLIGMVWLFRPSNSYLISKIGLTLVLIYSIYQHLNGWLFNLKVKKSEI